MVLRTDYGFCYRKKSQVKCEKSVESEYSLIVSKWLFLKKILKKNRVKSAFDCVFSQKVAKPPCNVRPSFGLQAAGFPTSGLTFLSRLLLATHPGNRAFLEGGGLHFPTTSVHSRKNDIIYLSPRKYSQSRGKCAEIPHHVL